MHQNMLTILGLVAIIGGAYMTMSSRHEKDIHMISINYETNDYGNDSKLAILSH